MGVVYLAKNVLMDRREVLKVVNKALLDKPGVAERFLREIRSAAMLRHNNVVQAYSAVQAGELLLFAMEYVDGEDLDRVVQRQGPLPIPYACHYVSQAAMGLQHAHEHQMVHRDVKPQNLILSRQGRKHVVKVLDFGLAKAKREGEAVTELTGAGAMMGTPAYMAPEQAQDAASADIRADIYSLGCTLYFLLTGAPPFTGKSAFAILQAHVMTEPTPLSRVRAEAPAELAAVVAKMMAKEPARRYQTPIEAAQALAAFIKPGSAPAEPAKTGGPAPTAPAGPTEARKAGEPTPAGPSIFNQPTLTTPGRRRAAATPAKPTTPGQIVWIEVDGVMHAAPALGQDKVRSKGGAAGARTRKSPGGRVRRPTKKGWKKWPIVAACGLLLAGVVLLAGIVLWVSGALGVGPTEAKRLQQAWANRLELPVEQEVDLGGGVTMKFVLIPPGTFTMGSPKKEDGHYDDEGPQHPVEITRPFLIGAFAVTREQFAAFVTNDGYQTEAESDGKGGYGWDAEKMTLVQDPKYTWRNLGFDQADDDPVVDVSWNDAGKFCQWLSKKQGLPCELPTEAEWEYACRAGTTTAFSFGDDPKDLGDYAWYDGNSENHTHPVGVKHPNPWGLYDMHGNVWQWCADGKRTYQKETIKDPKGPENGSRVLRGGSWNLIPRLCRSAVRDDEDPGRRYAFGGFRVVLRVPATTP